MTFLPVIALQTIGYVAAVLAGLAVIAYVLKMRRRRFEVPFSTLWQRVLREKDATSLWKHLRRLLSLLLQLVIIGGLLLAVLNPRLGSADADARSVVIILDTSASMKATDELDVDGAPLPRLTAAKRRVIEILDSMGGGDSAMIMRMDGQTTPMSRFDSDIPMLRKIVDGATASDTPADLRRALSAAADALRDRHNPLIILVGDGAYREQDLGEVIWDDSAPAGLLTPVPVAPPAAPDATAAGDASAAADLRARTASFADKRLAAIDLRHIDVRYVPVGQSGDNVGVVAFNARRYIADKMSYEIFVEVQNLGKAPAARKLVLYDGDTAIDLKEITLAPGERLRRIYPNLSGGTDHRMRAVLEPATTPPPGASAFDAFDLDDTAYALLPRRKHQNVLLVTRDDLYLEAAMLVYEDIVVWKMTPEEYEADLANGGAVVNKNEAAVFDDYTPTALPAPQLNLIYFNPQGEHSPFPITRTLNNPKVTETNDDHPVMRWVSLSDVHFLATSVFRVDPSKNEVWLAQSVRDPLMAAKRDSGRKVVAIGFSLSGTDITMRVAFPLLVVNSLDWFAGDDSDLITTYQTGQRFRVPLDGTAGISEAEVALPGGKKARAPIIDGHATFYGNTIGVHRITASDAQGRVVAELELAANLANPTESDIAPSTELNLGGRTLAAPEGFHVTRRQDLWLYLVLAALLLLCVEWITYHRRVTV